MFTNIQNWIVSNKKNILIGFLFLIWTMSFAILAQNIFLSRSLILESTIPEWQRPFIFPAFLGLGIVSGLIVIYGIYKSFRNTVILVGLTVAITSIVFFTKFAVFTAGIIFASVSLVSAYRAGFFKGFYLALKSGRDIYSYMLITILFTALLGNFAVVAFQAWQLFFLTIGIPIAIIALRLIGMSPKKIVLVLVSFSFVTVVVLVLFVIGEQINQLFGWTPGW